MKKLILLLPTILLAVSCKSAGGATALPEPDKLVAPSGVTLTAVTDNSLEFSWSAVNGADSYTYKLLKGMTLVKDGSVQGTSAGFSGLEPATAYKFAVKSVKGTVMSGYSDYAEATTLKKDAGEGGALPDPISDVYAGMQLPASEEEDGLTRAFPGAEGGGMFTTGGRGGKVLHVTSLEDSGAEGTLRWAVKQDYPRTVVFDVAGIIHLKSPLKIEHGDLTVAGQTAPGDGICIADRYTQIAADNVIIRFVRFRLGDRGSGAGDSDDAIWGRYQKNIIIDHCSMSWSIDECASFYSNSNFTMQWCIIAESLKSCSLHTKGDHGYGGIWGGENASFHHNLLAHHDSRNPRFDHPHIYSDHSNPSMRGVVDFRNNVIYDWGSNSSYGGEGYGAGKGTGINIVANCYKPGPSSTDRKYFLDAYAVYSSCSTCGTNIEDGYPLVHIKDNVHSAHSDISSNNASGIYWHNGSGHTNYGKTSGEEFSVSGPSGQACVTTTHNASQALTLVCEYAGASLSRDKVDRRTVSDVKEGKGRLVNDIQAVEDLYGFSWPDYSATDEEAAIASGDSDGDGIPDYYEALFGLDPKNASDGGAVTIDKKGRYSNFELYLHYLVRGIVGNGNGSGDN
ncbi:MAG: fibronectin type III domain-containing protein [Candidatus Cryptobacteroides sp.]